MELPTLQLDQESRGKSQCNLLFLGKQLQVSESSMAVTVTPSIHTQCLFSILQHGDCYVLLEVLAFSPSIAGIYQIGKKLNPSQFLKIIKAIPCPFVCSCFHQLLYKLFIIVIAGIVQRCPAIAVNHIDKSFTCSSVCEIYTIPSPQFLCSQ